MKLFLILGNQLFNPKYLKEFSEHTFYMAEDFGLCKTKLVVFILSYKMSLNGEKNFISTPPILETYPGTEETSPLIVFLRL